MVPLAISLYFWRNAAFATVRGARFFATACLLQEIAEAGGWLQLYCRLHHLFCMTSAGAVAVLLLMATAVMSVPMRLVLVLRRRLVVAG